MRCRVVREELYHRDLGRYFSYGIVAVGKDGWTAYIPDISTREWKVQRLAERMNRLEAAPVHLLDMVLDSLE